MCTVLQQHLNRVANGYGTLNSTDTYDGPRGRSTTPGANIYHHNRTLSPVRFTPTPIYSYLQDSLTLKVCFHEHMTSHQNFGFKEWNSVFSVASFVATSFGCEIFTLEKNKSRKMLVNNDDFQINLLRNTKSNSK